jgi:hypothetical protein
VLGSAVRPPASSMVGQVQAGHDQEVLSAPRACSHRGVPWRECAAPIRMREAPGAWRPVTEVVFCPCCSGPVTEADCSSADIRAKIRTRRRRLRCCAMG